MIFFEQFSFLDFNFCFLELLIWGNWNNIHLLTIFRWVLWRLDTPIPILTFIIVIGKSFSLFQHPVHHYPEIVSQHTPGNFWTEFPKPFPQNSLQVESSFEVGYDRFGGSPPLFEYSFYFRRTGNILQTFGYFGKYNIG